MEMVKSGICLYIIYEYDIYYIQEHFRNVSIIIVYHRFFVEFIAKAVSALLHINLNL